MAKVEITKDTKVFPGDELEFHYTISSPLWLKSTQLAIIESRLEKEERFEITGYSFEGPDEKELVMRIRVITPRADIVGPPEVQEAGVPVAAIIIAIGAAASALFVWLSLGKMYKITTSGTGAVLSLGAVGIVLIILLTMARK